MALCVFCLDLSEQTVCALDGISDTALFVSICSSESQEQQHI